MLELKPKNRIKEIRKKKGLRQSELAKEVGIFQSEISEIETGVRKPNVYLAKKIARALGVSIGEIFWIEKSHFYDYDQKNKEKVNL
jgi:putative transcriptional regulator